MSSIIEPLRDMFDAGGRGLQHHGLRRANERAILTIIGFSPGVSNADIARLSGLAPQTVSAILADIDLSGIITRGDVRRGGRGQPATPIYLRSDAAFSIGVEIGWRKLTVVMIDLHANILGQLNHAHEYPDANVLPSRIAEMIETLVADMPPGAKDRLADMGVSMPGNLADKLGLIEAPDEQRALWNSLDIGAELRRRTGLDVVLFNDGNAACWAELIAFPKPRPPCFVYFLISHHIAAGIVGEGTLWEGPTGSSANLGSMLVMEGAGQWLPAHLVASVSSLIARLAEAGIAVDAGAIQDWDWASFEPVLDQWIDDSAQVLSRVIFNTTTVVEGDLVIVDGLMPRDIVERLVSRIRASLAVLPVPSYRAPRVLSGHLGALAPAIGAAELPLYRRYFSRALVDAVD